MFVRSARSAFAALLTTTLWAADPKSPPEQAAAPEPPFEKLLELNAPALFGGSVKVEGDRFTLKFLNDGGFAKGFNASGGSSGHSGFIAEPKAIKDEAARKELLDDAAGVFSLAGLQAGNAVSNFELADDWKITFKLRMPVLLAGARFTLRFNQDAKGKEYLQSTFFQDLILKGRGKNKSATNKDARFAGRPETWFDRKSGGVPITIAFAKGQLSIQMGVRPAADRGKGKGRGRGRGKNKDAYDTVEMVILDGIESPAGGRFGINFEKCSFLVSDLEFHGKLPRKWIESELDRLRQSGKLLTKPSADVTASDGKKGKQNADVSKPDPESEVDL